MSKSDPNLRRWFVTVRGWRKFLLPRPVLPTRRQRPATLMLHFGLGLLAWPFWIRDIFRSRATPRRVLFVGRYHLGDFLMFTPALLAARKRLPQAWFGIVVQEKYSSDISLDAVADAALPEIDESQPFFNQIRAWLRRFREHRVDAVVFHRFTRPDLPAALAAFWLGLPHRVGGADKGIQALLTDAYIPANREKVVEYHQHLISEWLDLPPEPALIWPDLFLPPLFRYPPGEILIAPFAQHSKIWPTESWHILLRELRARSRSVALSAAPGAAAAADELLADFPEVKNLARTSTSLRSLFETVQSSSLVITVDTGIRHVAAMLGVPCVVLGHGREHRRIMDAYVPTERYLWNAVPCAPCGAEPCPLGHLQCIHGITAERVLAAIDELQPELLS